MVVGKHAEDRDGKLHPDTAKGLKPEEFEHDEDPVEDDDDD